MQRWVTYINDEVFDDIGDFLGRELVAITSLPLNFKGCILIQTHHLRKNLAKVLLNLLLVQRVTLSKPAVVNHLLWVGLLGSRLHFKSFNLVILILF